MENTAGAKAFNIIVRGLVQGVGYRYFAQKKAYARNIKGWVRNLPTGEVQIHAEGTETDLKKYISDLYEGPSRAEVQDISVENLVNLKGYDSFEIEL